MNPLHIGIAACSAEGAALCYRTICTEAPALLGTHDHPEVTMHTPSLGEYMDHIYRGDWQAVGEMMLASAEKLARVGADFVICPDNTIHQALPYIEARSPLPWLHIAACVADEADARGFRRSRSPAPSGWSRARSIPQKLTERRSTTCARTSPSARRSTASSWTSWCAASSSPSRSPTSRR